MVRVAIFGTHIKQFNGYSKVVYELCKAMNLKYPDVSLHVFGFQNFYNHPGHRLDFPASIELYDAHAEENPKQAGFGVSLVKSFVARVRPDICVVFNDLIVLTSVLNELKDAPNRSEFKVLAYIDQVYLCQRKDLVEFVNQNADGAIAFTDAWRECIQWQGLRLPCHVLPHGVNPRTYYPVPRRLARRFFNVPENDFLVLNLNRNQPRKRWDTCLQAFAEVVKRLPDAPIKLVIGTELKGAWDLLELYERELKKRGVSKEAGFARLVIPGHAQLLTDEETNVLYNIADIGINTCDGEGFGLCNFEQAAIGIPQIVPKLGGFLHFFDEPDTVSFVDTKLSIYVDSMRDGVGGEALLSSPEDYADAIVRYYQDTALRAKHGMRARDSILRRFQWSDNIADIFKDIIDKTIVSKVDSKKVDSIESNKVESKTVDSNKVESKTVVQDSENNRVSAEEINALLRSPTEPAKKESEPIPLLSPVSPDSSASSSASSSGPKKAARKSKSAKGKNAAKTKSLREIRELKARLDALLSKTLGSSSSSDSSSDEE